MRVTTEQLTQEIDQAIAERRKEIEALENARAALTGKRKPGRPSKPVE